MSNSGALTSSGGGNAVQLQADVTGLTQFLLNIGIAGFKHHALAGVDTHTIVSMIAIAEVCPASMQCRMRLNQRRSDQRQQSVWLYKVVEVGARTNFIVDQLLQTRAGENIMAMMSSLAPLLSKNVFNTATLSVFQKRKAPDNNVPGLAQLERFRDTILPLASVMDIKDKVFQYHRWILQQLGSDQPSLQQTPITTNTKSPYAAMPDPETIANVICYLAKLVEEQEEVLVLVYHGLLGAAWVAAYAQDVLGLPVCMFVRENLSVPLSGDHNSARVILRLHSKKQTCELRRVGKVEDFIKIKDAPAREDKGWIVDVRVTKYYSGKSTPDDSLAHIYATLARSLTHDYVRALAESLNRGPSEERWSGMKRLAVARLPLLQRRALTNMSMLGFECASEVAGKPGWKAFITGHTGKHQRLAASKLWADTFGSTLLDPASLTSEERRMASPEFKRNSTVVKIDFNADGQAAVDFLLKAVNFASTLAFTNWGQAFCCMSVRYLQIDWRESWLSEESRPLPYRDPKSIEWRDPTLEMLSSHRLTNFTTTDLLRYAVYITTDTDEESEMKRFLDPVNNLIATSCEGLVVARTLAMSDVITLRQIELLSFYPGSIVCRGESMTSIRSESSGLESFAELVIKTDEIAPSNAVRDLNIVARSLMERHEVLVESQIMLGTECCQLADVIAISETIPQLLVSDACPHDYYRSYQIPERIKTVDANNDDVYHAVPVWQGGLSFQSKHRPMSRGAQTNGTKIYVQSVDGNPQGRWIACQWTSDRDPFAMVLQENSCLECIFENLNRHSLAEICIINGGTTRHASSSSSKSHMRTPSHDLGHSQTLHSRQPSTTGQDPDAKQRHASTDSQDEQAVLDEQSVQSPGRSSSGSMGVPLTPSPTQRRRTRFSWFKQKDPC